MIDSEDRSVECCEHTKDPNADGAERTGRIFCNIWKDNVSFVCLCYPCLEKSSLLLGSHPYITYDADQMSYLVADNEDQFTSLMDGLVEEQFVMDDYV
jgi:hypothetical protein